jgi:predicted ATPase/DNA-binding XRE family transcriptional regulator/Tfp pilus assembly protein PilF
MAEGITFGSWLKQRRKELGLTQEELAERVDCSYGTMRKLEADERRPSGQIAHLLAGYFHVPDDEREAFVTFARTGRSASGEAASHAPWREVHLRQTNLPTALTPLVGREQQERAARDYLLHPKTRLLTMTGPPGIGKTRLALHVASALVEHFEDGVHFVDLSPIVDPDLVLPTVARSLRLKESTDRPIESVLLEYVRERRMLLLLDNFEQVLDATPDIVRLMQASPWLKIVVTSREALHVRGERRFPVPPLEVPSTGSWAKPNSDRVPSPSDPLGTRYSVLSTFPSVELFVQRAQEVSPDFVLTEENADDVAEVCVALEGLPLAIELAAARVRHLSLSEMRAALDRPLKLLTGGGQDLPTRQRTLRAAIEWSYRLLDRVEQAHFRRLGIFLGSFTRSAAESVCGRDCEEQPATQDIIESLVDKSLLKVEREIEEPRFGVLETIREFAREQLDLSGEGEATERRYAETYLALAERRVPLIESQDGEISIAYLDREHDNLRAALQWLFTQGQQSQNLELSEMGLRLAVLLTKFWEAHSYYSEWRTWMERALEVLDSSMWKAARNENAEKHRYWRSLEARIFHRSGSIYMWQGDYHAARNLVGKAVEVWRELGEKEDLAFALHTLALINSEMGEKGTARELYEESLALQREVGTKNLIGRTLNNLGIMYRGAGELDKARPLLEERLALARAQGDRLGIATALDNLGLVALDQEDFAACRRYQQECLPIFRELGNKRGIAEALSFVGMREVEEGEYEAARDSYIESLTLFHELGIKLGIAKCLSGLAAVFTRTGRPLMAARLWGAVAAIREAIGTPLPPASRPRVERHIAAARTQLDASSFEAAWAEGRAMPLVEAIADAMGETATTR